MLHELSGHGQRDRSCLRMQAVLSALFSPRRPDELKIKYVKECLVYSRLFEDQMEASFTELWVCSSPQKDFPPESYGESYEGPFAV